MKLGKDKTRERWSLLIFAVIAAAAVILDSLMIVVIAILFVLIAMINLQTKNFRKIRDKLQSSSMQSQNVTALYAFLKPEKPLPEFDGYTLTASKTVFLADLIMDKKPGLIVELGSGISTIVGAYCLHKIGSGKIISFEGSEEYANITRNNLRKHGLEMYAEVIYVPIDDIDINGKNFRWYKIDKGVIDNKIDLLFVDGPVGESQKYARYPALPFFRDQLAADAVILLDDTDREEEQVITQMWMAENPGLQQPGGHLRRDIFVGQFGK